MNKQTIQSAVTSTSMVLPLFLMIGFRYCDKRIGSVFIVIATVIFFYLMYKFFNDVNTGDTRGDGGGIMVLSVGPIFSILYTVVIATGMIIIRFMFTCEGEIDTI